LVSGEGVLPVVFVSDAPGFAWAGGASTELLGFTPLEPGLLFDRGSHPINIAATANIRITEFSFIVSSSL
jgi:hypothetical protein